MFRRFILTIFTCTCFLLTEHAALAQFSLIKRYHGDTLVNALRYETSDSIKVRLNYLLVNYWGLIDIQKAVPYLQQAAALNKAYPFLLAAYPFYEGYIYWDADKPKTEALFLKAERWLSVYNTDEAFFLRSKSFRNYALLRQDQNDQQGFIDYILKAIPLARQSGDSSFIGLLYNDAGVVFMNNGQHAKAAEYYEQSIAFANNSTPDNNTLAYMYARAAENYIFAKNFPKAKEKLDEEVRLYARLQKPIDNIEFYLSEGMYYQQLKNYPKSDRSFDKGIALAKEQNDVQLLREVYYQKFVNYKEKKDFKNALSVLNNTMHELSSRSPYGLSLNNRLMFYNDYAQTYAALGNTSQAYKWLKAYSTLSDSAHNARLHEKIGEMELRFQTAEKQKKINELEVDRQKALLKAQTQQSTNRLLGVIIFTLLLSIAFLIYYFRNTKKQAQHQLKEAKQQKELEITHALLQGEERERKRVARDLHDGLGGMLAGIKMNLSAEVQDELNNRASLDKVITQLDNSIGELRRIARNMMPEMLARFGLETALRELCGFLSTKQVLIQHEFYQIKAGIDPSKQLVIYRIVQELLSNALKHADAKNVYLQCSQNENIFLITVEDDGKGFDSPALNDKKGMGLHNVRNRVNLLNGKMELSSTPNEGTTVNIEIDVAG